MTQVKPEAVPTRNYDAGAVIFREGERTFEMYIIISGRVRIVKEKKNGQRIMLAELKAGAVFGEMALISKEARSATAIAEEASAVKIITPESFQVSAAGIPPWAITLARVLVHRLRNVNISIEQKTVQKETGIDQQHQGQTAVDSGKSFSLDTSPERPEVIYLKGYFFRSNIEPVRNAVGMLLHKSAKRITLDFSYIIDIDKDAIAFLSHEIMLARKMHAVIEIQNVQLIHSKLQNSLTLQKVVKTLEPPLRTIGQGDYLMRQDTDGDTLFIVRSGRFKITRTIDGKEIDFAEVGTGDVIGEMALIAGGKRSASVRALSSSSVYSISADQFSRNEFDIPQWFLSILKQLVERIRNAGIKFDEIVQSAAEAPETAIDIDYVPDRKKAGLFKLNGIFNDRNVLAFENRLIQLIRKGFNNLVFDLSAVENMTEEYAITFHKAVNSLRKRGGSLHLIRGNSGVNRMLEQQKLLRPYTASLDFYTHSDTVLQLNADINFDTITGLYHKTYFMEYLREEMERARRYKGHLSLLAAGIDRFDEIAGNFSVPDREQILRLIGQSLKKKIRKTDIAARGGEYNFFVTLPGTDGLHARKVAEKFLAFTASRKFLAGDKNFTVSCSAGIAVSAPGDTVDTFFSRAEECLGLARKGGYNQVYPEAAKNE